MPKDINATFEPPKIHNAEMPGMMVDSNRSVDAATLQNRHSDFDLFIDQAAVFFNDLPSDMRHARMETRSGFYMVEVPNLPEESTARAVQIFYGETPAITPCATPEHAGPEETGAALVYRQAPNGSVTAFLHPTRSKHFSPEEDGMILGRYSNLEALTGRGTLAQHWAALRSYAEVSSLDGEPNWVDYLRVSWLRFSRRSLHKGRVRPARAGRFMENLACLSIAFTITMAFLSFFG